MKMLSKPSWLRKPIDVVILADNPGTPGGYCKISANDFYVNTGEDNVELARFDDLYEAFYWLSANDYAPIDSGRTDGVYRNVQAADWFYKELVSMSPVAVKQVREKTRVTPLTRQIILFLAA